MNNWDGNYKNGVQLLKLNSILFLIGRELILKIVSFDMSDICISFSQ